MPTQQGLLQLIGAQYIDALSYQKQIAALQQELAAAKAELDAIKSAPRCEPAPEHVK